MIVALAVALALGGPPLPPDVKPWPIGVGPGFRLAAAPPRVLAGEPVGRFRCEQAEGRRFGAHLELFVRRRVLLVPAGVGVARGGRCSYPLRTREPTGVIEIQTRYAARRSVTSSSCGGNRSAAAASPGSGHGRPCSRSSAGSGGAATRARSR